MASTGKVTGVHIWAFLFGIGFFVLMGIWYMQFREREKLVADLKSAQDQVRNSAKLKRDLHDAYQDLVVRVGHEYGQEQSAEVVNAMRQEMQTYGASAAQPTYSATLTELRKSLTDSQAQYEQLQDQLEQVRTRYLALKDQFIADVENEKTSINTERSTLVSEIESFDTSISTKEEEVLALRKQLDQEREETQNIEKDMSSELREKQEEIRKLLIVKRQLDAKFDGITNINYVEPDGIIINVDNSTRLVWLNIGSRDGLTTQTTFNVYSKGDQGTQRTKEDIKAEIEITRIWENRAEAKITSGDLLRPVSVGDEVFSPLWQRGKTFSYSFVGTIDLDGDKISDRELLHDLVSSSGAVIDNEVSDDGEWLVRKGLDQNTKFVVIGSIPNPEKIDDPANRAIAEKVVEKRDELINDARLLGTRLISLNDFLAIIDYNPKVVPNAAEVEGSDN